MKTFVIGDIGEAEIDPAWSPEEAYQHLCGVSEACGYSTTKREWYPHHKVIEHINENGRFYLTYWHDILDTVDRILYKRYWTAGRG